LVRTVIESLTSAARDTTIVVFVDDVNLLDDLSTFVLHQIVARRTAKVVLTVRDGEAIPAGTHEIWKVGRFDRLDLQPLSRDETNALVSATLGGPLDPDAARRLWELTRGNVLYLRNIVDQEVVHDRLAMQNGLWRWIGDPVMPPGLIELIETRVGTLSGSVSTVIDTLAVGEPIPLASLSRIVDPAAVEEADARGLITLESVDDAVEVRVAHPLYGEVRRKRAPATRLRRLRGLVASELAVSDDRDTLRAVVRRATLIVDSDLELDAGLFVRAAHGAVWQLDLPLADRLAEAAIRAGGGLEASLIRAFIASWLGRGAEAESIIAGQANTAQTDFDHARLTFLRCANRLFSLADPPAAKQLIDEASRTTPQEGRSCIYAAMTVYSAAVGEPQAARAASRHIAWEQLPDVAARMTAWAITVACGDAGQTTEAAAAAEAGYLVPMRAWLVITDAHAGALILAGLIADAQHVAALLGQRAADFPSPHLNPVFNGLAGRAALAAGRIDTACALLGSAVGATGSAEETVGVTYRYRLPLTTALAMRGMTGDAASAFASLRDRRHPGWQYLDYEWGLAQAWVAACEGAVSEAIAVIRSTAETARANGQFAAEVMCLQTATQFGDRSCASRLRELEAIVEGPRACVAARFAEALQAGEGDELAAVSQDFERIGDWVAAADAAAHAAMAHRHDDRKGSALTCSARADALAEKCGGANTPALRQASERLPLSDREREIAMLIGQGLSSRAIAERLTLSVRTVEGHIYRAMTKTGAVDREQLAAMLPPRR
jgi:DNA-binding CsgD family transcriptional regulator